MTLLTMGPPAPYFCIHCGHPAPQVYKTYANGNLVKLLNCKNCGELIDKFVEYDYIIVALNLILLNPLAYRHVLLNHAFMGFWKLAVVTLFIESYCFWCIQKGVELKEEKRNELDFFELEINFYTALFRTLFYTALFHISILFVATLQKFFRPAVPQKQDEDDPFPTTRKKASWKRGSMGKGQQLQQKEEGTHQQQQFSYTALWKGLCLSGFAESFKLIALIWSYSNDMKRLLLVDVLRLFSVTQGFHVTTGANRPLSLVLVLLCFIVTKYVMTFYDTYIPVS